MRVCVSVWGGEIGREQGMESEFAFSGMTIFR